MTNGSEGLCYPDGKAFLLQKAAGLGGPKHRVLLMDKTGASKSLRTFRILLANVCILIYRV